MATRFHHPTPGHPDIRPDSIVVRPSPGRWFKTYRSRLSQAGSLVALWAAFVAVRLAVHPDHAGAVLLAVTGPLLLVAVAVPVAAATTTVTASPTAMSRRSILRRHMWAREEIAGVERVYVRSIFFRSPFEYVLFFGRDGSCLLRMETGWCWSPEDAEHVATVLNLAICSVLSGGVAGAEARHPGSIGWWLRHPWVSVFLSIVAVMLLVVSVLAFMDRSFH